MLTIAILGMRKSAMDVKLQLATIGLELEELNSKVTGAVQCSAVQCSAVQCSAVQCSAVQCTAVLFAGYSRGL